jgi:hypothetical protein
LAAAKSPAEKSVGTSSLQRKRCGGITREQRV